MEDGFDLDEQSSEETEPEQPPSPEQASDADYWRKRAQRAEKQAVERKVENGRLRIAAKHGIEVEKIPDYVPLDKMDEFAETFLAQVAASNAADRTEQQVQPQDTEPVPEASEAERQLAAVAKGPGGASSPSGAYTSEEALQLAMTDPDRYRQLRDAGLVSLDKLPGSDRR